MQPLWFILVAFLLNMYVVLDGFDLGGGVIHLFAAQTNEERRLVLPALGSMWDQGSYPLLKRHAAQAHHCA